MEIEIMGQHFQLLAQKAILWKDKKTLLASDLHLGKVTHFRKAGIAVPSVAYVNNFTRLDELMKENDIERIFFLGDLFHNRYNEEWAHFTAWRARYSSVEIIVVPGNHDILPYTLFEDADMSVHDDFREGNFLFTHHPATKIPADTFVFSGHIHPVHILRSPVKQNLRLPCFVFDEWQAILPSFGVFTGGFEMRAAGNRKIFIIAGNKIFAT